MPLTPQNISGVAKDSISQPQEAIEHYYAPKYTDAFPDSTGNCIYRTEIAKLPIMELPAGKAEMNYIDTPIKSGGTMLLILISFIFVAFSFSRGSKYVFTLIHHLFTVKRQRNNMFEDHTVSESQMMSSLIANTCVVSGVFLFSLVALFQPEINISNNLFYSVLGCILISLVLYLFQYATYYILGYVFDDKYGQKLWIVGYNALYSMIGLILTPVILLMLIYPNNIELILNTALIIYILIRILFICKGFRIFFNNLVSIPYFILYLCNVEIVPIILSYAGAIVLCKLISS